jgi:predicted alpha/beta superfamily hydrolase
MKILVLFILSTITFSTSTFSQNDTIPSPQKFQIGITETLHSEILKEDRFLNIYFSGELSIDSISSSTQKLPVIYLLDGSKDEDFLHIVGIVQFLTMMGFMEPTYVVGIANVDRKRDFTFPTTIKEDLEAYPTTGHSSEFMEFLEREMLPFVQKKYHVQSQGTIIGQSLGGLLATEILLTKPQLFSTYIIVSPSLWWDNESLLIKAPELLKSHTFNKTHVIVSVGKEHEVMVKDAETFAGVLQKSGITNLISTYNYMPDEDHATILHNCVYKCLMMLSRE